MKHYLGICLILITLTAITLLALHACTAAVDHSIQEVRSAFSQVLRVEPEVSIHQRVIMTQTAPIAELAVVTKEERVSVAFTEHWELFSHSVPLTEKNLTAEADFRIKAGFNLRDPFKVQIDPAQHDLRATMPHAVILSVEQIGDFTFQSHDALLDPITDEDRAKILDSLHAAARDAAEKSPLKQEAEEQVRQRLMDLIQHNGQSFQIDWTHPPPQIPVATP